jgi:large subunit ribosomal protein L26e
MKYSKFVSSSRRKCRKAHFSASSGVLRKILSSPLSKELRAKYNVRLVACIFFNSTLVLKFFRSLPVRKGDEIKVARGTFKDKTGIVKSVFRRKGLVYFTTGTRYKINGNSVDVGVHPSKVYFI